MTTKPPALINADSRPVLLLAVLLTGSVALVSFALSFAALRDVATWGNVPSWLTWAVPVMVDASMLVYTLAALVQRQRGASARLSWFLLALFSLVSVAANAAHGYDLAGELRPLVGVSVVALAPVGVLASVHTLASLVVAAPVPAACNETSLSRAKTERAVPEAEPGTTAAAAAMRSRAQAHGHKGARKAVRTDPAVIAQVLRMRSQGLAQQAVGEALGISQWSVSRIERDQRGNSTVATHEQLLIMT